MSLYANNPLVCQRSTTDNEAFDEEHELALIARQLADDDDYPWSPTARRDRDVGNLRRLLAQHRALFELRELLKQVRRETASQRQIGGAS